MSRRCSRYYIPLFHLMYPSLLLLYISYVNGTSQKVEERINRALTQRLYLVNQEEVISNDDDDGLLARNYAVLGSTNNVYDIYIGKVPTCSCPDFEKGHLCKHILFVMLKVLRVHRDSPLVYQKALLQSCTNHVSNWAIDTAPVIHPCKN